MMIALFVVLGIIGFCVVGGMASWYDQSGREVERDRLLREWSKPAEEQRRREEAALSFIPDDASVSGRPLR